MSITNKTLEELDVIDDFLMNALTNSPDVGTAFCRRLLSVLLQKKIGKVRMVSQRALFPDRPDLRGIRMDVEVEEIEEIEEEELPEAPEPIKESAKAENKETTEKITAADTVRVSKERVVNVYDIEPHLKNDSHLPKRNRFYQAKIDSRHLESGEKDFSKLPNLYVITITDYDFFGKDHMVYTFRNRCRELPELTYDDGLEFIYFYTNGTLGGCESIKNMLKYIRNSNKTNVSDEATRELHGYVSQLKVDPDVKVGFMKFEEIIYYERREAAQEAALEAKKQFIQELLEEYGTVPDAIKERLEQETNEAVLDKWRKLAIKSCSVEEFTERMDEIKFMCSPS